MLNRPISQARVGTLKKFLFLFFYLLISSSLLAQEKSDPESALRVYFNAVKVYDTEVMSKLMHPDALARFRRTFDAALLGPKSEQARAELLPLFEVTSIDEFASLSDMSAFKRLNETVKNNVPHLVEMMSISEFEIVGKIEKDDVTYFTYTLTAFVDGQRISSDAV